MAEYLQSVRLFRPWFENKAITSQIRHIFSQNKKALWVVVAVLFTRQPKRNEKTRGDETS